MTELFRYMRSVSLGLLLFFAAMNVFAQAQTQNQNQAVQAQPPIDLTNAPIRDQLNSIESRTRIYENFRAVREDMFQKLKKNVNDTLSTMHKRIADLNNQTGTLRAEIDSLNSRLGTTRTNLDDMTRSKNSVPFLGMEVEKGTYNSIMWSIIIILLLVLLTGFLVFRRNQKIVVNRNKDLEDLKAEFEAYRKTSREAREKMALQHFNELKKLRGE
ncbi:MAG TPA: hypothetical protein VK207_11405 [Bacteroidales bacterium]|nr:hypothetical protein [Bacteroidales bacterium]